MKQVSLLLICLLASASSLFAQQASRIWSGDLDIYMHGHPVDLEQLSHQVFCLANQDTLTIVYQPASSEGEYAILGCELWGQVSLGEPTLLAQVSAGQPGNPSQLKLPLAAKIPPHLLPETGKAVRVMLRVRRIIEVDGRRYMGHYDVPESATDFTFLLTRKCE